MTLRLVLRRVAFHIACHLTRALFMFGAFAEVVHISCEEMMVAESPVVVLVSVYRS